MRKAVLLASVAFFGFNGIIAAHAADPTTTPGQDLKTELGLPPVDPFKDQSASLPPILQKIEAGGTSITALTPSVGGLNGYLLESPEGKMQTVYMSPDGKSLVVGVEQALSPDGQNLEDVTLMQFGALKERFADAQKKVAEQQAAAAAAQASATAARQALEAQKAALVAKQAAAEQSKAEADSQAKLIQMQQQQVAAAASQGPSLGQTLALPGTSANAPAVVNLPPPAANDEMPTTASAPSPSPVVPVLPPAATAASYVKNVSKATFLSAVEKTAYFRVGKESNPTLYLAADPQCPHCHAVWHELQPLVAAGKITVKVILVAALPHSDKLVVDLLSGSNPGLAFYNGSGSVDGVPVVPGAPAKSEAARKAEGYLQTNMDFLDREHITGVPWMGYVGADGHVYETSGEKDLTNFLADLK